MISVPQKIKSNILNDNIGTITSQALTTKDKKWVHVKLYNNPQKYTLRGLHFQITPFEQAKLVKVLQGRVCCFTFDINKMSPFYLQLYTFELTQEEDLLVTRGYATGFLTLEPNTIVQIYEDNLQSTEHEGIIPWTKTPLVQKGLKELDKDFLPENVIVDEKDITIKNFVLE